MDTSKPFASLSQTLLARKGGAKPAIRPHFATSLNQDSLAHDSDHALDLDDDLEAGQSTQFDADIVPISREGEAPHGGVHYQQDRIVRSFAGNSANPKHGPKRGPVPERRSAFDHGRKAAFTLRLDEDRHLRLRLACTATGQSAQQVVTDALDKFLSDLPELAAPDFFAIAGELRRKRNN